LSNALRTVNYREAFALRGSPSSIQLVFRLAEPLDAATSKRLEERVSFVWLKAGVLNSVFGQLAAADESSTSNGARTRSASTPSPRASRPACHG
jgi:hypothetical protein